ncbi:MAG: phosphoglycerate dehydrogenase [Azospirillum sp.]|nr:phosphoglycerate dehydrogenase [Azospirillum sp.]
MTKLSLSKSKIPILLLEGIDETALAAFRARGYDNIEALPKALDEADLIERIATVRMIGIRSRTQLNQRVLSAAKRLIAVGCFCIGTNQVDVGTARRQGVPVFNAPYSNTRSVAELVIAEIILLMRGIPAKNAAAHRGTWLKSAKDSFEIRGKVLGIVGYGHIGTQLSVLAESMGMQVRYYDIVKKLAIGNAQPVSSLDELLDSADVVSLHVPDTKATRGMIGPRELGRIRKKSYLINASRGTVVDIPALAAALADGHLAGAAIDVFPEEPASNNEEFHSPLRAFDNVLLTPHIGGSTLEAQANIGTEVADKLIEYSDNGATVGAVNFVPVALPVRHGGTRFLHIHKNQPGVLKAVNEVFARNGLNITGQYLQTDAEIGYVVIDLDGEVDETQIVAELRAIDGTVRARFLY